VQEEGSCGDEIVLCGVRLVYKGWTWVYIGRRDRWAFPGWSIRSTMFSFLLPSLLLNEYDFWAFGLALNSYLIPDLHLKEGQFLVVRSFVPFLPCVVSMVYMASSTRDHDTPPSP
jgi:hypothetical protein